MAAGRFAAATKMARRWHLTKSERGGGEGGGKRKGGGQMEVNCKVEDLGPDIYHLNDPRRAPVYLPAWSSRGGLVGVFTRRPDSHRSGRTGRRDRRDAEESPPTETFAVFAKSDPRSVDEVNALMAASTRLLQGRGGSVCVWCVLSRELRRLR